MAQRGQFLPDLKPHSSAVGRKDDVLEERRSQKWTAVAAYIASGMADAGFGMQTAAERFGLTFISLVRERYFLRPKKRRWMCR